MADLLRLHNVYRHSFGRIEIPVAPPNLLSLQTESYEHFLQHDTPP